MLPLGPAGAGASPYSSHSAFAGNPLLVSPELLVADGLLPAAELDSPAGDPRRVDFAAVGRFKERLLRVAFARLAGGPAGGLARELRRFRLAPDQAGWLEDWCLYCALKARHGGASWTDWPRPLRRRERSALDEARRELAGEIDYHAFVQFLFARQWRALHQAARAAGLRVFGDIPIYVALDSADVWARPRLFDLDAELRPRAVAGVPPDYFSRTGQLWGNPLYRWDRMKQNGFAWWIERLRANLRTADVVRIDHFRAFSGYWAVPAGEATAIHGRWRKAPGRELFAAVRRALGEPQIVAEDLGLITPDVERLIEHTGFPGMKVLQFAFGEDDHVFLPHNHLRNSVVYTGTHDNDTTRGWWSTLDAGARARVLAYVGGGERDVVWNLVRAAYQSVAERAIVPLQDALDLGAEARMNTPAQPAGNWSWRAVAEDFTPQLAERLRRLAELTGRA